MFQKHVETFSNVDTLRLAVQFQGGASQSRERHQCKVATEKRVKKSMSIIQAAGSCIHKSDRFCFFCKKNQKAFHMEVWMQNLMEPISISLYITIVASIPHKQPRGVGCPARGVPTSLVHLVQCLELCGSTPSWVSWIRQPALRTEQF